MVDNDYGLKTGMRAEWVSDAVADMLRAVGVPYIALNPGASYRGLHDSLVDHLGNERPEIVMCLHEEHAVAVAHGYAKVTGRPMAAGLHANVGLMHATMALFNAFCDRVPLIALGATGPVDAAARRPWIDWIHTAADQAALVRPYVKWDDQPASAAAAVEAVARADRVTRTYPSAPVYVCLDAALQETALEDAIPLPDLARHRPPAPPEPAVADVEAALAILNAAERPVLLAGRTGRGEVEWDARVALAERLGARVLTDLKAPAAFPTRHPLHPAAPGTFLTPSGGELIRSADAVLALDWIDLGGTLAPGLRRARRHAARARDLVQRRPRAAQRLEQGPLRAGAGRALRGTARLAVAVLGDGDFLMGATALWT